MIKINRINWRIFGQETLKIFYWLSNILLGVILLTIAARILELLILGLIGLSQTQSHLLHQESFWELIRLSLVAISTFCFSQLSNLGLKLLNFDNSVASWGVPATKVPNQCYECQWYHGRTYNGNFLVCGIYPYGKEHCSDFEEK